MAIQFIEGSATISTTEHSLVNNSTTIATNTDQGVVQLALDLNNMAIGDTFVIRLRERARAADTQRIAKQWTVSHTQIEPLFISPSFTLARGWDFTVQRVAGSDRSMSWSIRRIPTGT